MTTRFMGSTRDNFIKEVEAHGHDYIIKMSDDRGFTDLHAALVLQHMMQGHPTIWGRWARVILERVDPDHALHGYQGELADIANNTLAGSSLIEELKQVAEYSYSNWNSSKKRPL